MTAYGTPDVVEDALDLGAFRVVPKPLDMSDLSDLVIEAHAAPVRKRLAVKIPHALRRFPHHRHARPSSIAGKPIVSTDLRRCARGTPVALPVIGPRARLEAHMVTRESVESVLARVRPYLVADGGDIELVEIRGNSAVVKLSGMCAQCPSAHMTLHLGVETACARPCPILSSLRDAIERNLAMLPTPQDLTRDARRRPQRKMRAVFDFVNVIGRSDSTVLITGESGTGKEVVATADSRDESSQASSVCRGQLCAVLGNAHRVGALRP